MDWDKIEQLLNIVDKAKQWPSELAHIHQAAMAELKATKEEKVEAPRRKLGDAK